MLIAPGNALSAMARSSTRVMESCTARMGVGPPGSGATMGGAAAQPQAVTSTPTQS
jgi:hypothetical protein